MSNFSRREILSGMSGAAMASAQCLQTSNSGGSKPNVLLILCDQMRGDALSCLGSPNARTPHLDWLASRGVLFERCFSNNPVCVPSRKSIFSGLYPHQHGSLSNPHGHHLPWDGSLAHHFEKKGYRTGYVGKNHTFEKDALKNFAFTSIRDREPFRAYPRQVPPNWHMDSMWPEEKCYATVNTNAALDFLSAAKPAEPFFLTVSYFDPHPPYMAPASFTSRYASKDMWLPERISPSQISKRLAGHSEAMRFHQQTDADLTETLRYYYAAIEYGVDHQVGRLMKALEERNLDDTVVIFTSDHGDFMGHYGMVRKGMLLYDHLLHVPMIIYHPKLVSKGLRVDRLVDLVDIFPTAMELTGDQAREGLSGRSLLCLLRGGQPSLAESVIATAGYGKLDLARLEASAKASDKPLHTRVFDQVMEADHRTVSLRTGQWRFTLSEADPPELFELNGAVGERKNVVDSPQYASVRRELEERLTRFWPW
jgi:arylsulfatase A-like enzyme